MKRTLICIVFAVIWCSATVWSAPRADAAVAERLQVAPVPMRVLDVPAGLSVAPAASARAAAVTGRLAAWLPAPGLAAAGRGSDAASFDAGMRFTMVGVICGVPSQPGAVSLRLRTSLDGSSWSSWRVAPLELAAEAGGPPQAFTQPVWTGAARYVQVQAFAAGADPAGCPPRGGHVWRR